MKTILFCILVFTLRFLENYLVRMGTIKTLSKKTKWATILDFLDESLGLLAIAIIVIDQFYLPYSLSSIVGSAVATYCVSERWPDFIWKMTKEKKKTGRKNKYTGTTA